MEMQGNRQLAVTQQQAWEALNDPEVLKLCIPGCDQVEATAENRFSMGMALKVGPVSAKFSGKLTLSDIVPPASYTISFEGQGGAAGFGKGNAKVQLIPNDTGCELAFGVRAQIGGKVAQLGQRLIDGAAKSMAEDFFKRFDEEMRRRHPAAIGSEATVLESERCTADEAAAQVSGAAQLPSSLVSQKGIPGWLWIGGVVALALAAYLMR